MYTHTHIRTHTLGLLQFCDPELTAARTPEKDNTSKGKVCRNKLDRRGE